MILPADSLSIFVVFLYVEFNLNDFSKVISNHTYSKLLFSGIWAHKPHTKTNRIKNSNSNIPRGTVNDLNRFHLRQNQYLTYYQPHNKRGKNQYVNSKIDNKPAWNNKKEG